jgi:WD40 repeat protein
MITNVVAINPNGNTVVGTDDEAIKIWNLNTGQLLRTVYGHSNFIGSLAISTDGQV